MLRKEDLIAYARRDWAAVGRMKRRRWAEQHARMTPDEIFALSDELREHAASVRPDLPTERDRQKDLANHVRVSELLRRVKPPQGR